MSLRLSALAIGFAIVLPIYGQQKGAPAASQGKNTEEPAKSDAVSAPDVVYTKNNYSSEQDGERSKDHPNSYLARLFSPENLPNIALVVAGIVGISVAVGTLHAIKRQADLTQATLILQFPPKLKVRNVVLVRNNPPFHNQWFVEFTIVNAGGSRAHITHSSFDWEVFEDGLPPHLLHDIRDAERFHVSLLPGEERVFFETIDDEDLIGHFRMYGTHDKVGNVQQRSRFLYFFGHAKYQTDRLTKEQEGTIRAIGVCRHYNLREGRFVPIPDYEYED